MEVKEEEVGLNLFKLKGYNGLSDQFYSSFYHIVHKRIEKEDEEG